jgi:hypothetical protein
MCRYMHAVLYTPGTFQVPALTAPACRLLCLSLETLHRYMYVEGMKLAQKYEEEEAELAAKLKVGGRWGQGQLLNYSSAVVQQETASSMRGT